MPKGMGYEDEDKDKKVKTRRVKGYEELIKDSKRRGVTVSRVTRGDKATVTPVKKGKVTVSKRKKVVPKKKLTPVQIRRAREAKAYANAEKAVRLKMAVERANKAYKSGAGKGTVKKKVTKKVVPKKKLTAAEIEAIRVAKVKKKYRFG